MKKTQRKLVIGVGFIAFVLIQQILYLRPELLVLMPASITSTVSLTGSRNETETTVRDSSTEAPVVPVARTPPFPSPRNQTGSWIGNTWIPPRGWRSYSAVELQTIFNTQSVLFVGDSTARRSFHTLYAILNSTDPNPSLKSINDFSIIMVNKHDNRTGVKEPCTLPIKAGVGRWAHSGKGVEDTCRPRPLSTGDWANTYKFTFQSCLIDIDRFVESELNGQSNYTAVVDLMVIGVGVWESVRTEICKSPKSIRQMILEIADKLMKLQEQRRHHPMTVIWRTSGFHASGANSSLIRDLNTDIMDTLDTVYKVYTQRGTTSNITYVHWGGTVEDRSFGNDRIAGDVGAHYGFEPRHALIQMMANRLLELRRESGKAISFIDSNLSTNEDGIHGPSPVVSRDKVGSWIGNTWIPPKGWNAYSTVEFDRIFRDYSAVFVGDSTIRRAFGTLYTLLNYSASGTDKIQPSLRTLEASENIDVNRNGRITEPCRYSIRRGVDRFPWVQNGTGFEDTCRPSPGDLDQSRPYIFAKNPCLKDVLEFLENEVSGASNYTESSNLLVLGVGIWETVRPGACQSNLSMPEMTHAIAKHLVQLQGRMKIIWRTSGFHLLPIKIFELNQINKAIMDSIDEAKQNRKTHLAYVNWGGIIENRSLGADRIAGDMGAHYGLEGRLAAIQMIANRLQEISGAQTDFL